MVEIRVAVPEEAEALGLLRRLATVFSRSSLSFDAARNEVRIHSEWESRSVISVIDAVQSWLAEDGAPSVALSVGARSHTLTAPNFVGPSQAATASTGR